jgi:hypothetical protein
MVDPLQGGFNESVRPIAQISRVNVKIREEIPGIRTKMTKADSP